MGYLFGKISIVHVLLFRLLKDTFIIIGVLAQE